MPEATGHSQHASATVHRPVNQHDCWLCDGVRSGSVVLVDREVADASQTWGHRAIWLSTSGHPNGAQRVGCVAGTGLARNHDD